MWLYLLWRKSLGFGFDQFITLYNAIVVVIYTQAEYFDYFNSIFETRIDYQGKAVSNSNDYQLAVEILIRI